METTTITLIPCEARSDRGHACVESHGHVSLGLTHMDALGNEWLDSEILGTYLSNPAHEMALAS